VYVGVRWVYVFQDNIHPYFLFESLVYTVRVCCVRCLPAKKRFWSEFFFKGGFGFTAVDDPGTGEQRACCGLCGNKVTPSYAYG